MDHKVPEGFTMIPLDQRFNYTERDIVERKGKEYWAHRYCPEAFWPENLPDAFEVSKQP